MCQQKYIYTVLPIKSLIMNRCWSSKCQSDWLDLLNKIRLFAGVVTTLPPSWNMYFCWHNRWMDSRNTIRFYDRIWKLTKTSTLNGIKWDENALYFVRNFGINQKIFSTKAEKLLMIASTQKMFPMIKRCTGRFFAWDLWEPIRN